MSWRWVRRYGGPARRRLASTENSGLDSPASTNTLSIAAPKCAASRPTRYTALEETGEIQRVGQEVDWNLEIGAIIRRSYDLRAPAPLFTSITGYQGSGFRVLGAPAALSGPAHPLARIALKPTAGSMIAKTFFLMKIIHRILTRSLRGKISLHENLASYRPVQREVAHGVAEPDQKLEPRRVGQRPQHVHQFWVE
jgi:hypothetical protein